MNILLVNHYAGSPKYGMEFRPYYLAREWVKQGHRVRIIAASESHLRLTNPSITNHSTLEYIDGIEYIWLKTPTYYGNGAGRVVNMLAFSVSLYIRRHCILNNFTPNIVIASSPHPFIFRGAKHIARQVNAKLVFEVRDIWPLSLVELLGVHSFHPLIALMQNEENYAYKYADKVVALLPKAYRHMSLQGLDVDKFIYIPNGIVIDDWYDFSDLSSNYVNEINKFKSKYEFLVGYAGTHGIPNALSYLIDAAKLLEDRRIGIVLVGDGIEKCNLILQAQNYNLMNVLFLNPINKNIVPSFLYKMDALFIGWERKLLYEFGISANKIFEYMMSGKPIIHSVDAGNDPVNESGCGVSCEPENHIAICDSIVKISSMCKNERALLGFKGREYVKNNFNYTVLASQYLDDLS